MRPLRVLVTAGGTVEPLDDVRVVANTSTGRFGAAIARALAWRGAEVTVLGSRTLLDRRELPPTVRAVPFTTFGDLCDALSRLVAEERPDAVLMAAAVSDYAPVRSSGKIRSDAERLTVELVRNPKLIADLRRRCPDALLVGFKLLSHVPTEELIATARRQITEHRLDLCVANDLAELGGSAHPVWLVARDGEERVEGARDDVAGAIADAVLARRPAPPIAIPWPEVEGPVRGRARRWWQIGGTPSPEARRRAEAALARLRVVPHRPVQVADGGGWLVGCAPVDIARAAEAWAALACPGDAPFVHDGRLAAVVRDGAYWPTGLGDDDVWPQIVGATKRPAAFAIPANDAEAWRARGYVTGEPIGDRLLATPPWARADRVPAASACLVDVANRRVLLGRRLRGPAAGAVAFPGGHVEPGESPEQAARRELLEETGIVAPAEAPWWTRRTWAGADDRCFEITAHVWRVAGTPPPRGCAAFEAAWTDLDAPGEVLPGVRLVLEELRHRLDAT